MWTPPDQMSACGVSAAVLFTSPRCGHFLSGTETQPRIVMLLCVLSPPCLPSVCSPLLRYQTLVLRWWASLQPSLSYSCSNFFLLTMSCLSFDHLLVTSRYCQVCRNTAATLPVPTADRFDLLTRTTTHIFTAKEHKIRIFHNRIIPLVVSLTQVLLTLTTCMMTAKYVFLLLIFSAYRDSKKNITTVFLLVIVGHDVKAGTECFIV